MVAPAWSGSGSSSSSKSISISGSFGWVLLPSKNSRNELTEGVCLFNVCALGGPGTPGKIVLDAWPPDGRWLRRACLCDGVGEYCILYVD